jgi:ATP-binding cassette, subfamily C (CFTR/MRP), member 1
VLQLTVLLLWAVDSPLGTQASIPAATLDFVAACTLCVLSSYEHTRSIAPSVIIDAYLFFSLLFDAARLRTLFLIDNVEVRSIAVVGALSVAIKVGVLVSEASSKRAYLLQRYHHLSPEVTSGTYSKAVFWWLNDLLRAGYSSLLGVSDLYEIDERLSSAVVRRRFEVAWAATDKTRKHALLLTTAYILRWQLLLSATPRLILVGFKYAQPFLLIRTISYVSNRNDQPTNVGWALIGAYAIIYVGMALCTASFEYLLNRCLTIIRGGLVTMIYTKTVDLSLVALDENAALTLMSADAERIIDSLIYFHDIWASFIEVGIAVYLLYVQIGIACLAPAAVFFISGGGMFALTTLLPRAQKRWIEGIQYRVSFTSTMLGAMRSIKLLGLSRVLTELTQNLRVREVELASKMRKLFLVRVILQNSPLAVAPLATFGTYIALGSSTGHKLESTTAFGVLSVLNLVESPLRMLIVSFPTVVASTSCFVRIQEFLLSESRKDHRLPMRPEVQDSSIAPWGPRRVSVLQGSDENTIELSQMSKRANQYTSEVIVLEQCSFGWSLAKPRIVQSINLRICSSTINMIIGPVGCGKSTLLKGILGETPASSGFVYTSSVRVAFADQDAWYEFQSRQRM